MHYGFFLIKFAFTESMFRFKLNTLFNLKYYPVNLKSMTNTIGSTPFTIIKDQTTMINEYTINYSMIGSGKHHILFLPGAMGTMESDFEPQFSGFDKTKYTLISWDPIGYGKSRPPERDYIDDFYVNDAKIVAKLMKKLDVDKYSVVGWSDGAITGLVLAALYPTCLNRLVALAPMAYVTQDDVDILQGMKDISKWTPKLRHKLEAVYGADYLARLWISYCDYFECLLRERDGEVCRSYLPQVRCPTLVIHGSADPVVPAHHGRFVAQHVRGARLQVIEGGKHNLHYKLADKINATIDSFFSEDDLNQ